MVAGGGSKEVSVFDVQGDRNSLIECLKIPNFDIVIDNAVSKVVNQIPWICGGSIDGKTSVS